MVGPCVAAYVGADAVEVSMLFAHAPTRDHIQPAAMRRLAISATTATYNWILIMMPGWRWRTMARAIVFVSSSTMAFIDGDSAKLVW